MSDNKPCKVWIAVKIGTWNLGRGAILKTRVFDSYKALNAFLCPNTKRIPYRRNWIALDEKNTGYAKGCRVYSLGEDVKP